MTPRERAEILADTVGINPNWPRQESIDRYERAIKEAVAEEREACAKVLEKSIYEYIDESTGWFVMKLAQAIRKRGE